MINLTPEVVTKRIKPDQSGFTVAAGTSAVNSDRVDTAGYEGVRFICGFGAIVSGAVTSVKARQNTADSDTGMADLEGSSQSVADTDDNKIVIVDIRRPRERYVQLSISRATQNATVDFLVVELYGPRVKPVTQDTTVIGAEVFNSPAEGTA